MRIFLSINTDVSYQRIVDRLGREQDISQNLKTIRQFAEAMSIGVPDVVIVDKNISFYENVLLLKDSVTIITFEGSFPALLDKLSDRLMQHDSTKDARVQLIRNQVEQHFHEDAYVRPTDDVPETTSFLPTLVSETTRTFATDPTTEYWSQKQLQQVIGVWGAAGGIGKTEIAKNLALYLGRHVKVALLDLNLVNPDIGDHLGIGFPQGKTLYDAYQAYLNQELQIDQLQAMFVDYHGVKVLVGLPDAVTQSDLSVLFFTMLIKSLRSYFDVIVIDMDNDLTAASGIQVLSYCNRLIVPITTSSTVLGHTKVYVNLLRQGRMEFEKIDFVLNKQGEGGEVTEQKIAEVLGKPPVASIRYDHKTLVSVDKARPLLLSGNRNVQKVMEKIAQPYVKAVSSLLSAEGRR